MIGGGPIGLELAQAHARLGCLVTVIEAETIASRDDPECVLALRRALEADGVEIREHSKVARVEQENPGLAVLLEDGTRIAGTHLLLATGRAPRLAGLDLPAARVTAGPAGIRTDR